MAKVPHGHWRTLTFLAALRVDRIEAPCVIDGPINGEASAPTSSSPGADAEAWRHRHHGQSRLAQERGRPRRDPRAGARRFFLPPYSPDLNPIEQVFAKLKHLLRKAQARTVEATWRSIGSLIDSLPPDECANYLRNAGYASV